MLPGRWSLPSSAWCFVFSRSETGSSGVTMKIVRILVITDRPGMDRVSLITDQPDPSSPQDTLSFDFLVTKGRGEAYCSSNFPDVEIKVMNHDGTVLANRVGTNAVVLIPMPREGIVAHNCEVPGTPLARSPGPASQPVQERWLQEKPRENPSGVHEPYIPGHNELI